MFEEILITALSEIDDDTLNYILESCTEDELNYIDMAIEAISDADRDQLRSGYKLDTHNGIGGFVKSFRDSGADKWKNLAHDAKTEFTRVKNNLKGDGGEVATTFIKTINDRTMKPQNDSFDRALNARNTAYSRREDALKNFGKDSPEYKNADAKYQRIFNNSESRMNHIINKTATGGYDDKIRNAVKKDKTLNRNFNSLSYKIGTGLKAIRDYTKDKINDWKANRQQNQS